MDWLTFISHMVGSFAWPAVLLIGLILFRQSLEKVILSLKFLRYKDFEMELVEPGEASDQELNGIISYLLRSPHSFQWFRNNTDFRYTDDQFDKLIAKHTGILEEVTIVRRDAERRECTAGLPGMRLTRGYREMIVKAVQNP